MHAEYERLAALGVTFTQPPTDMGPVTTAVLDELARGRLSADPEFQSAYAEVRPGLETDRLFADESLAAQLRSVGGRQSAEIGQALFGHDDLHVVFGVVHVADHGHDRRDGRG